MTTVLKPTIKKHVYNNDRHAGAGAAAGASAAAPAAAAGAAARWRPVLLQR